MHIRGARTIRVEENPEKSEKLKKKQKKMFVWISGNCEIKIFYRISQCYFLSSTFFEMWKESYKIPTNEATISGTKWAGEIMKVLFSHVGRGFLGEIYGIFRRLWLWVFLLIFLELSSLKFFLFLSKEFWYTPSRIQFRDFSGKSKIFARAFGDYFSALLLFRGNLTFSHNVQNCFGKAKGS